VVEVGVEEAHDVGVADHGQGPGLAAEAVAHGAVREQLAGDELEGDVPGQVGAAGPVDRAHAPGAQELEDLVGPDLLGHAHRASR